MCKLALTGGAPLRTAPFPDWPMHGDEERNGLLEVLESGKWWYGERVREFEEQYAAYHDAAFGVSCMNGSMALEIGLWACGIEAGDEVIVPAYTFIATPICALRVNAVPVFADIDLATCNMDIASVERLITPKTKALMPVHFGGLPVDMDAYAALAKKHNLKIIEDACHSWGSKWKGKGTGALGDCGGFSFQVSKNITAGEGGIMLTDNEEVADLARSMSNYGRGKRGAWYRHLIPGTNLRMTEFQAAVLLAQLSRLQEQTLTRMENAKILNEGLAQIPGLAVLDPGDERVTQRSWHLYIFRFLEEQWEGVSKARFMEALAAEGIPNMPGYGEPLYENPVFSLQGAPDDFQPTMRPYHAQQFGPIGGECPNTARMCREAVWLHHCLLLGTARDMHEIVEAAAKIWEHREELRDA